MKESYHIFDAANSTNLGPYSVIQLREMYRAGTINAKTFVCLEGSITWQEVSAIEHKFADTPTIAPPSKPGLRIDSVEVGDKPLKKINPALGCLLLLLPIGLLVWAVLPQNAYEPTPTVMAAPTPAVQATPAPAAADNPVTTPPPPPVPVEIPISDLRWADFRTVYGSESKMTDFQKDHDWPFWQGKRVRWTGTVAAISGDADRVTLQVKMDPDTFTSDLIIDLRPSEGTKALELQKGSSVTFTATFVRWGSLMPTSMTDGVIDN